MGKIRRCFVDLPPHISECTPGTIVNVDQTAAHHLRDVTRAHAHESIVVVDRASGRSFHGEILQILPTLTVKLDRELPRYHAGSHVRALAIALSKGDTVDLVVEKATELGVGSIVVWHAQRSIPSRDSLEKKVARWAKIAESAALQSGRNAIPSVRTAPTLKEAIKLVQEHAAQDEQMCFLSLSDDALQFREMKVRGMISMYVGPEGDFHEDEEKLLRESGATPCSLGPLTLRCETAAIAGVSMSNAVYGFVTE